MPHVEFSLERRNSVNRPAGTLEAKAYSITADNFLDAMTMDEGMVEAIEDGFREHWKDTFKIQMDNAPGHTGHHNLDRLDDYLDERGFDIEFSMQPPNSPDLNLCDLTLFRSLDSQIAYMKDNAHNMMQLMEVVTEGFEAYDPRKLESRFGHLFSVFRKILEHRGGNEFRFAT
jgi:hypothetical protein